MMNRPDALPAGAKAIEQRQAAASATSATSATVSPTGAPGSFVDGDHSRYEEAYVPLHLIASCSSECCH